MKTQPDAATEWPAPVASGPIDASVEIPGSKSLTNRYLMLSALASTPSTLHHPLEARDTALMRSALRTLGTEIDSASEAWRIQPQPWSGPADIDCGLAGNVMRFVPAVAGLAKGRVSFDGDSQARRRPIAPMIEALRQLGVEILDGGRGTLPFEVEASGVIRGGNATIDSSASSQFITALLLAGCRYVDGLTLTSIGATVPSRPHIEMTLTLLRQCGVDATEVDKNMWRVAPSEITVGDATIEPDLSNATPFLAAALMTGGRCRITGWPPNSVQPVDAVRNLVEQFGGNLTVGPQSLEVHAGESLTGADLDMSAIGELVPTVTALATVAGSPTTIRGVAHLRGHETDRLAALATEYNALGGDVTETSDGLLIKPKPLRGGIFHTYHDHRLATAAALTGLVTPGIFVENVATTSKTLPNFPHMWERMLDPAAA